MATGKVGLVIETGVGCGMRVYPQTPEAWSLMEARYSIFKTVDGDTFFPFVGTVFDKQVLEQLMLNVNQSVRYT